MNDVYIHPETYHALLRGKVQPEADSAERAAPQSSGRTNGAGEFDADERLPAFPEAAWRGLFTDYRDAMRGTTEAPETAHFATLWAAIAVALGRKVSMYAGDWIFPNVYLGVLGPTGNRKTTAMRRLFHCGLLDGVQGIQVVRNVGSTEGLAQALQDGTGGSDCVYLMFWEELSALLARGRWSGSTVLEFITETFDCPLEWSLAYRRNPPALRKPTPTILCGTTPEWFWKNARPEDFFGGFANRFLFLAGDRQEPLPLPAKPDAAKLAGIQAHIAEIARTPVCRAQFTPSAARLWETFYRRWQRMERTGLLEAALQRTHIYACKLAMAYAAAEATLPEVTLEQLRAAISVALYAARCTQALIDAQAQNARPEGELEKRFLAWVQKHEGQRLRYMQQTLSKYCGSAEIFNRIVKSLMVADLIEIRERRVYLAR